MTQQLPGVEPLGRFPVNFVKIYNRDGLMMKAVAADGDDPTIFFDIEHPQPHFTQQSGTELHIGISGNFRVEQVRKSRVKPHVDIYLPVSEIPAILSALVRANMRMRKPAVASFFRLSAESAAGLNPPAHIPTSCAGVHDHREVVE